MSYGSELEVDEWLYLGAAHLNGEVDCRYHHCHLRPEWRPCHHGLGLLLKACRSEVEKVAEGDERKHFPVSCEELWKQLSVE